MKALASKYEAAPAEPPAVTVSATVEVTPSWAEKAPRAASPRRGGERSRGREHGGGAPPGRAGRA